MTRLESKMDNLIVKYKYKGLLVWSVIENSGIRRYYNHECISSTYEFFNTHFKWFIADNNDIKNCNFFIYDFFESYKKFS